MDILTVKNVKKEFILDNKKIEILKGISFNVKKGEFISIIGSSGSGKSTLLNVIAGLDKPDCGDVLINNQSIIKLSEDDLSQIRNQEIGFVFQSFYLVPSLTAFENIALPQEISKKVSKKDIEEIMKKVGIEHRKNNYPIQLSGGEKQRVAIARALINKPKILFADEPTGNLDSKNSQNIIDLLIQLKDEEDITLIIVTHEEKISKLSNRVIEIRDGQIIKDIKNE